MSDTLLNRMLPREYRESADYVVNRADKKIEGPLGKKITRKSRIFCQVSSGGVGAEGLVTKGVNCCMSWNQI